MIATLTTDRLLVGLIVAVVLVLNRKAVKDWLLPTVPPQRRRPVRSAITFRGPRPYDWEKE